MFGYCKNRPRDVLVILLHEQNICVQPLRLEDSVIWKQEPARVHGDIEARADKILLQRGGVRAIRAVLIIAAHLQQAEQDRVLQVLLSPEVLPDLEKVQQRQCL